VTKKKKKVFSEFAGKSRRVRSPNEEDQTPPELRGCGQPSFVQPDLSPTTGTGKPDNPTGRQMPNGSGNKNGAVS
jgi:hypothetical protein